MAVLASRKLEWEGIEEAPSLLPCTPLGLAPYRNMGS